MSITGATRFRSNWRGKLILQVQYQEPFDGYVVFHWRDARTEDLAALHALHFAHITVRLPEANVPGEVVGGGKIH